MAARRIGEILVAEGVLTEAVVNRALGFQRVSGDRIKLGTILLNWDLLAEEGLLQALARHHRVAAAPWSVLSAAPVEVTRLVPAAMAIRLGALPYAATASRINVAFLDPSDLAAQDEIAAITRRRVTPAVALEIRMLQAQQRSYGHHVPIAYRSIMQKIERRTTTTARLPEARQAVDFRAPDLVGAQSAWPPEPRPSTATRIPIQRGAENIRFDLPAIAIPEMPMPAPPPVAPAKPPEADRLSDTRPTGATPTVRTEDPKPDRLSDTNPIGQRIPEPDEKLSRRMGPAFASLSHRANPPSPADVVERIDYQPEHTDDTTRPGRRRGRRREDRAAGDTRPREASPLRQERDAIADMWRPAPEPENEEEVPAPSSAELEGTGEARNRDEIGQVALEAFLGGFPRVLLLGCGKRVITGWQGRGKGLSPESVAAIHVPLDAPNVFSAVRDSGVPHFGPLEPAQWPAPLREALGDPPPDCAVFPIRVLDGFAAFLYADRLGAPLHYEDFAVIARAAAATASALARFLLRRNQPAPVR